MRGGSISLLAAVGLRIEFLMGLEFTVIHTRDRFHIL